MTLQCCWDGMFQITIQLERSGSGGGSGSGGQRDVNWATHLLEKLGASPATGEFSHQNLPILFCLFSIDLFSSILYIYFSQNVCVFMFNFSQFICLSFILLTFVMFLQSSKLTILQSNKFICKKIFIH